MKILVLTHNYPRFRGDFSGAFIEALSEAMQAQGHQVTVLTPYDQRYNRQPADHRVTIRTYRYIWPDRLHIAGYMRSTHADRSIRLGSLVVAPLLFLFGSLATLAQAARDRPDILHAHWVLPNGFMAALTARLLNIPLVVSMPGADVFISSMNPLFLCMARFAFNQARAITTNSHDLRQAAEALGADARKCCLLIYGVDSIEMVPDDSRRSALRAQLGLDENTPVIVTVGRLVPKKGFDVLVKATPLIDPSAHVVIVGHGEQLNYLKTLAASLGIAHRVHFVGSILRTDLIHYYNMGDIFVMPTVSPPADGLNVAAVEAMSCGLPVVASDVGGNPLVVADGETGLLVRMGDTEALAAAINRLVADPAQRQAMGQRGRERVVAQFSWPQLATAYVNLFAEVSAAGSPAFSSYRPASP